MYPPPDWSVPPDPPDGGPLDVVVEYGPTPSLNCIRNRSNREPEVVQAEENQITGWVDHDCGLNCFHPAHNYDDMSKYTIVTSSASAS